MKNKSVLAVLLLSVLLFVASCGGAKIEGEWKIDPGSFDIVLGEGFPEQLKMMVEEAKKEAQSEEAKKEFESASIEFKPDGTLVLRDAEHPEEIEEINWKKKGNRIEFYGDLEGESFRFELDILEHSSDKMTLGITGEHLLEQIKENNPELIEDIPAMFDLNALVKGGKISIDLVKSA